MELTLTRNQFTKDGIFGTLKFNDKEWATLEHAYYYGLAPSMVLDVKAERNDPNNWKPKLKDGTYTCQKGLHRLENMTESFPAFEILNVPGHTNILLHYGNFNKDSEGCVLLGKQKFGPMITQSQAAFHEFMQLMDDTDEFTLIVSSV